MLDQAAEKAVYEPKDLRALLDRVASTLARASLAPGAPGAHRARARKERPPRRHDGAPRRSCRAQDMSDDPETVEQLLALIKANLPFKLLGVTLRQNDQNLVRLVEALSGTPAPAVRRALEDLVKRFPDKEAGRAASRAMAGLGQARRPAEAPRTAGAAATATPEGARGEPPGRSRGLRPAGPAPEPRRVVGLRAR